jgi:hypothetical protein
MSTTSALSAAALSLAAVTAVGQEIRPFRVSVPDADLTDLRRRVQATRWPDKETDPSQGKAWEQPELFASELRAAFRQFRGAQ